MEKLKQIPTSKEANEEWGNMKQAMKKAAYEALWSRKKVER